MLYHMMFDVQNFEVLLNVAVIENATASGGIIF